MVKWVKQNKTHLAIWEEIKPSGNIVDLGCNQCAMYEGRIVQLVGVDIDDEALGLAKKHYPSGVYIKNDCRKTELPSHQFDTVLMMGLLDYFEDWSEVIKEAKRLSRGRIFATILEGFRGHKWSEEAIIDKLKSKPKQYRNLNSLWVLIEI